MPPFENPTEKELKATLEASDGLPVGDDIEARLGKDPRADGEASEDSATTGDVSEDEDE